MKSLLKAVFTILTGDTTLKTLLGYTSTVKNIRSFETLKQYKYDNYLLFGKLESEQMDTDLDTSDVREYRMQVQALDRKSSINIDDINERVITLLHNTTLEEAGVMKTRLCEYERALPIFYDNELLFYVGLMYFRMIVTKLN